MVDRISNASYVPLLSLKPAEMLAANELPDGTKNAMLPLFFLGRWVGSHALENSIGKISDVFPNRNYVLEVVGPQPYEGERRDVHDELDNIRSPSDGYNNWFEYIQDIPRAIPCLQLADLNELPNQVQKLSSLGRGLVLRLTPPTFQFLDNIVFLCVSNLTNGCELLVILDFEKQGSLLLERQADAVSYLNIIRTRSANCYVSTSASSFPDSFEGLPAQDIFERSFFEGVRIASQDSRLIYSDRGSARIGQMGGGGNGIPPRIDLAAPGRWSFFRSNGTDNRPTRYRAQAVAAMDSPTWDDQLQIWGMQQVELTALGDENGIGSQAKATAARINMHIHTQAHYGNDDGLYDTEDDWSE